MNAIVVYESNWGNTAAIARAIAEGIGPDAEARDTDSATENRVKAADLIVAGAPLLGFALPTEKMRESFRSRPQQFSERPDLSHPILRQWIDSLPEGHTPYASFETRIWWSPGSAAKKIGSLLEAKGYRPIDAPQRFLVLDRFGPLKEGEIERAKAWGAALRDQIG